MGRAGSELWFERACRVIPGGVNSPVRAWRAVGGVPRFLARAEGARVFDVDGRSYIDYVGSWGPAILGHAHPQVIEAVREVLAGGTSFGAPTTGEVELAERLVSALPSVEQVRLVNSGTEATMTAIRLARAATGRDTVIKFDGCYHGHSDTLLVRAGSGAMTLGIPDSPGVPADLAKYTTVLPFNDLRAVEQVVDARGEEIAAVIVEPIPGNMGVVAPLPGFLEGLRRLTAKCGAVLIFDEVMTGFRVAYGGAQVCFGIEPDLTCLGKVVGGGLPLAAVGGRRSLMELLAPAGPVYQAGTLSGNPLAVAAGLATLRILENHSIYEELEQISSELAKGIERKVAEAGIPACLNRAGSMWTLFFGVSRVTNAAEARRSDARFFRAFFQSALSNGIYLPPSPYEAAFVSAAHGPREVELTVAGLSKALDEAAAQVPLC